MRRILVIALASGAAASMISGCHIIFPFTQDDAGSDAASVDLTDDASVADREIGDAPADAGLVEASTDSTVVDGPGTIQDAKPDVSPLCGNGKLDPGEICDDGNKMGSDLCTGCQTLNPLCTIDNVPTKQEGMLTTDTASDIVPLCDGWILLGSTKANEVQLLNAISGQVLKTYQLPGPPGDLELDTTTGMLLVTLDGQAELVKINLKSGKQLKNALTHPALSVAVGPGGYLFVTLEDTPSTTIDRPLVTISPSGVVIPATKKVFQLLAFDSTRGHLIAGQKGLSPSSLALYKVSSSTPPVPTLLNSLAVGSNGLELALSPNNDHLALVCGGGNTGFSLPPYSLADFHADDPGKLYGSWLLGAYPQSAAFGPLSQKLVATNRKNIFVFSVANHSVLATKTPSDASCGSSISIQRAAYSRGGKLFFGYFDCITGSTARVYWSVGP